jgi:hypothetical protein
LLAPKADAVGYRLGWAGEAAERIREAVPATLTDVELGALDVEQLLTCPGLWTGTKLDVPFPSCAGELRRQLFHDVCVHYLSTAAIWGTIHPLEFAKDYLAA